MLYREFGKTNEKVSILGFGCMRLPLIPGGDPSQIDEEKAMGLVRYAIDNGVNYIDTAYPYHGNGMTRGGGASEPFVGRALKDGYREKVKLATKLPSWLIQSRSDMDKYLNEQLERLETDHIEIVDYYNWSFCQIQYNYLDEEFQAGTEGLEYAAARGLGVTIMEPIRGGKLVNIPDEAKEAFDKADVKRSPAEWALKWVWNHPEVKVVLSGMNTLEQLVENIKAAGETPENSLTEKELAIVDEVKTIIKGKMKVNCTACGYCMPCPAGVNIPRCFSAYNTYNMFPGDKSYENLPAKEKATSCVKCGKCEQHCPQSLPIREHLQTIKEVFA